MNIDVFRIRLEMTKNNLNNTQLAEKMSVSRQWLGVNLQRGYSTVDFINKLAKALNVDVMEIIEKEV